MATRKVHKQSVTRFTLVDPPETKPAITPVLLDTTGEDFFWHAKKGKVWTALFGVSIVFAVVMGVFIYSTRAAIPTPEPRRVAVAQATPTPTPKTSSKEVQTIEVLNGSGRAGEAATLKGLLEAATFTVSSVGNAEGQTHQKTSVLVKKTVPKEFLDSLNNFLGKIYILDEPQESSESEEFDVTIIVGRQRVGQR